MQLTSFSVEEVSSSRFAVGAKLAVPNTLADDVMKSYYWLNRNGSYGGSPRGSMHIKSPDTSGEGVSIAVVPRNSSEPDSEGFPVHVYLVLKDAQRCLHLYRRGLDGSFKELLDNNWLSLLR